MKFKASVVVAALLILVLAGSFVIGFEQVEESDIEGRAMTTFDMIFHPVEDEDSVIYNADKSASDRFEDAMKDQIRFRQDAVALYMQIDNRSYNLFDDLYSKYRDWQKEREKEKETETEPDVTEPDETEPDVTEPDETEPAETDPVETEPGETGKVTEPPETKPVVTEPPETKPVETEPAIKLDFEKYPGYGYARLEKIGDKDYSLKKAGDNLYLLNGTDWLVNGTNTSNGNDGVIQESIDQLTVLQNKYNLNVFGYFVSHASDTPWFEDYLDVTWADRAEHIAQMAPLSFHFARVAFKDLADYEKRNYKTDHHWSYLGSRQGYQDIYKMMSEVIDIGEMRQPIKTWNFTDLYGIQYRGSRAKTLQNTYKPYDEFIIDEYDYSGRFCFVLNPAKNLWDEIPVTLGLWDDYKSGNVNTKDKYFDHYIQFYGTAKTLDGKTSYSDSKTIFVVKNFGNYKHNLLMVGDSNMRALRDVMATHFGTTLYLDYRINGCDNKTTGIPQPCVDELIEQYNIDTILIVTQRSNFWASGSHKFKFSSSFTQ